MVHLIVKGRRGQVKGENTGDASVHAVLRCNKSLALVLTHLMDDDFAVAVFVHLRNQIAQRKTVKCFAVAQHCFIGDLFSNFQAKWVVVLQIPIPCWEVQVRLHAGHVHPSMGDGSHRAVDLASRDVRAFNEEFPLNVWLAAVGDVKNGELGEAAGSPRPVFAVPSHGVNHRVVGIDGPRIHGRNDHQLVAVEHHGHRIARKRHVGRCFKFSKFRDTKDVKVLSLEVVDVVAVGLDKISFVHARLLIVGA